MNAPSDHSRHPFRRRRHPACGRCRAKPRRSRSCRCPTAKRCSARPPLRAVALADVAGSSRSPTATTTSTPRMSMSATGIEPAALRRLSARAVRAQHRRRRSHSARCTPKPCFGPDAMLLVLPADHLIRDRRAFAAAVERATALARAGWLVTFGIGPTHPETGYGYIECGEAARRRPTRFAHAASSKSRRSPTRTAYLAAGQLRLELGHVLLHAGRDTCGVRASTRRSCSRRCAPSGQALACASATRRCWKSIPRCSPRCRTSRSTTR